MGRFLHAAEKTLEFEGRPLSPQELVARAIASGFLTTRGRTPAQTMKSKLSTDILVNKQASRFMRTEAGLFALRAWKPKYTEYVAPRYKKALFDEDILVFPRTDLFRFIRTVGITKQTVPNPHLLAHCFPMRRQDAENRLDIIQLVSFYLVVYKDMILTYKRSKRLPESRLHGFYSVGFGGHLNPNDVSPLMAMLNPEHEALRITRELHEELLLDRDPKNISFVGLLYDDSQPVSSQHIALIYFVELADPSFSIGERGFLFDPKFENLESITARADKFENWSQMLIRHLSTGPDHLWILKGSQKL